MEASGYGASHRLRAKSAISGFCVWLIEEKGLLRRNPARGVEIPSQQILAPRRLSPDQRYVLKNLAERDGKVRSEAIFALGYWAGCQVPDVSAQSAGPCHKPQGNVPDSLHKNCHLSSIYFADSPQKRRCP